MMVLDTEGTITRVNAHANDVFDHSGEGLVGLHYADLPPVALPGASESRAGPGLG